MENKTDSRRVKLTKKLLKESLIEQLKVTPLHSVTIKDICDGADVNRSTFYRHYNTQFELYYDLIGDIGADVEKIMESTFREYGDICLFLTRVLEYIEKNRETFLVLLSENGNLGLGEAYTRLISKFINPENTSELGTYITQFIAAGMTSMLWTWLNKPERRSAREVANLFHNLMMHGLKRAIDFSTASGIK